MKKFLSIILAVVMIASLLPATFVSAAEGDIVFDFNAYCAANFTAAERHTDYTASPMEGLTQNVSGTGANAGMLWETSGNTLRWNNTTTNWQTADYSASNANANNKVAFDFEVETAGWYRFSMPFSSNSTATTTVAVYDIFNDVPSFMGEIKYNTTSDAVYLEAGTHTLLLCCVYSGNGTSDALYINSFNWTKVDAPTGSVELEGFPTTTLGVGAEVTGLEAVVNTSYGAKQISGLGVKLAAGVKYRREPAGDTYNYLKVTYSNAGVATVTVAPNTAVGAKGSIPYSIAALAEGTTDVTFTPVIGGVEQTALATTKSITVMGTNIVYDFATFFTDNADAQGLRVYEAPVSMPNFAINRTGSAVETYQYWLNTSLRLGNVMGDWYTVQRNSTISNNKVVWDITVPAGKAGWYTPSLTFSANNATDTVTMYNIADGKTAYVGDFKPGSSAANAVYLYEGTNSLVLAFTGGAGTTKFVTKLSFTKLDAEPAVASVTADAPTSLSVGEASATYTATVAMGDGTNYLFPYRGVDANFYSSTTAATSNYLKITASPADVVSVTATNGGAGNYDKTNYTITGLKEGTATVTFTPVINGVEKTDVAVEKTINVVDENIVYDFVSWVAANIEGGASARHIAITEENSPANFGIADGMSELIKWDAGYLRFESISANWGSDEAVEDRAPGSRYAMTVDVPAGKAGWYTPQLKYHGNAGETGLCSVYHIYNGEATYLGDTVNSGDNYLAPVYLEAGENTIAVAIISNTTGMFVTKLAFTKYEGEVATLTGITVADPADLTVGETSAAYEITGAMSDGSSFKFPPLGMDTTTYHNSGANTTDYIKVTATPANVVDVLAYSGGYEGMDKYYYEVKAVSEGDVVLSFVPVVDGVEKTDLKVTKNISVTHPDGNITGDSVSIWFSATDVAGEISADAKALIGGDLNAGEINSVAVGTSVTVTAEDSEDLTFLYWYNGNSKRVLSDDVEYTFTAGTNTSVYAKYIAKGEEAAEYFNAAGELIAESEGTFAAEPDVKVGGYKLFKDTAAAVAEIATATATSADFVCWTKDGKAVSYNTTYTYAKWGNVGEAVEVTEGEKSSAPTVVLFENNGAYMLELVNFEGKTIIEKGILFDGDIDSCYEKAVSADKNVKQFTATGDGEAVAYVIYKDGTAVRVAYSD